MLWMSRKESKYRTDNELRICNSFAKKIWKAELDQISTRFDGCGLLADDNNFSEKDEEERGYIIPSKVFNNFDEFINQLKIPYYEDFTITVVNDGDNCFNKNNFIKASYIIALLIIILALL